MEYYEDGALVRDPESSNLLPNMAAGSYSRQSYFSICSQLVATYKLNKIKKNQINM